MSFGVSIEDVRAYPWQDLMKTAQKKEAMWGLLLKLCCLPILNYLERVHSEQKPDTET